jgi:diacylglycerol O-acyltransferase-1
LSTLKSTILWVSHTLNSLLCYHILVGQSILTISFYFVACWRVSKVGSAALVTTLILFLKLTSYALVNRELREMYLTDNGETSDGSHKYPNNITIPNILYFWWAPTLCYQPSYPRSARFRTTFFLKRVSELVVCSVTMYLLAEQYAKPTLENSLKALEERNYVVIVERVLKLSTTAVVIWLLMFYALFHAFLNALSEVWHLGFVISFCCSRCTRLLTSAVVYFSH